MIKKTSPLVYYPALHSAAAVGYESPSGASLAEFLMVHHDEVAIFHQVVLAEGLELGEENLLSRVFFI